MVLQRIVKGGEIADWRSAILTVRGASLRSLCAIQMQYES